MSAELQYPKIVTDLKAAGVSMETFLDSLDTEEAKIILNSWELWRLDYQKPPPGDWRRWILRFGRGCGKTHTGSRHVTETARNRKNIGRGVIGIIGRSSSAVRDVMVEGSSGILATAPADFMPTWEPGNGILRYPNGVRAYALSADKPEQIRGHNLSLAWLDEPAYWRNLLKIVMEEIEPALRMGVAQMILTTTPKQIPDLREIEQMDGTVCTTANTYQNSYLSAKVLKGYEALYSGTRIGRQEMFAEYLLDNERALWTTETIDDHRIESEIDLDDMRRIVVAIDPAVTADEDSDETGIIVAGLGRDGRCYILADKSRIASPMGWARVAVAQAKRWGADRIIAEVNNGGDMVESTIRVVDSRASYKAVRASRGKYTRAEPVAALYERGRVSHCGRFPELEEQLLQWDPTQSKSPDRLDALVWAVTELMLADGDAGPIEAYLS